MSVWTTVRSIFRRKTLRSCTLLGLTTKFNPSSPPTGARSSTEVPKKLSHARPETQGPALQVHNRQAYRSHLRAAADYRPKEVQVAQRAGRAHKALSARECTEPFKRAYQTVSYPTVDYMSNRETEHQHRRRRRLRRATGAQHRRLGYSAFSDMILFRVDGKTKCIQY